MEGGRRCDARRVQQVRHSRQRRRPLRQCGRGSVRHRGLGPADGGQCARRLSRHEIRDPGHESRRRRVDRQHLVDFRHHRPARYSCRLQRLEGGGAHPDQGGRRAARGRQYPGQFGPSRTDAADALVGAHRRPGGPCSDAPPSAAGPRRPRRGGRQRRAVPRLGRSLLHHRRRAGSTAALWRGSSGEDHFGEGDDANACRLQSLARGAGDDNAGRLVAVDAQRVEVLLQPLAVA